MSTQSVWRRPITALVGLLLMMGALSALSVTPFGRTQAAEASVTAGDVIFQQSPSGSNQNLIMQLSGSTLTNLSAVGGSTADSQPDVSPDGSRIVFTGERPCSDNSSWDCASIVVMNSNGSGQKVILPGSGSPSILYSEPVWSPDGSKIAFVEQDGNNSYIAVANADGSGKSILTSGGVEQFPAWSPDGSMITYQGAGAASYQIYVVNTSGTPSPHLVTGSDDGNIDIEPVWSPDGNRIYFLSSQSPAGIYYYTSSDNWATTGNVSTNDLGGPFENSGVETLKISADGSLLTYSRPDSSSACNQIWTIETGVGGTIAGTTHQLTDTGCDDWNSMPTFVWANWSMKHFAVLGDSYSSGEGVPDFISPSDTDGCHRSEQAYAEVLASQPDGLALSSGGFVACSGAKTSDVINGMDGEPSQFDGITSGDDIVILTVGGDDVGFKSFVTSCLTPLVGCASGSSAYNTIENKIQNDLPGELATLFSDLKVYAGSRRVLVLGYPRILPLTTSSFTCTDLTSGSQLGAMQVETDLNTAISAAVTNAGAPFEFVDADAVVDNLRVSPFAGHELCSDDPYFRGLSDPTVYSYHPNAEGQAAYAKLVTEYLSKYPTPPGIG